MPLKDRVFMNPGDVFDLHTAVRSLIRQLSFTSDQDTEGKRSSRRMSEDMPGFFD